MISKTKSLVLTFKSGKVSILTTEDVEAVENLLSVFENSDSDQNKPFKLLSKFGETYYIRPSEVAVLVVSDKDAK